MKLLKKSLAVISAAALLLSCFSACSSDTPTTSSNDSASNASSTQESSGNYNEAGTLPIVKETVELDVFFALPTNIIVENNEWFAWVEETTNIALNVEVVVADANEKLNLIMASQSDIPEVINGGIADMNAVSAYASQGLFHDYKDYWDKLDNMPEIEQKTPDVIAAATSPDGGIYTSIRYMPAYHANYSSRLWINELWLENVGMDMPTTTDEFYQVLQAFQSQDANGNGDPTDEIPLTKTNAWRSGLFEYLMAPFARSGNFDDLYLYVDEETNTLKSGLFNEGFFDGMEYIRGLYSEGLLDAECFVQQSAQVKALAYSENGCRVGAVIGAGLPTFLDTASDAAPRDEFVTLPPLEGPDGIARKQLYKPVFSPQWQVTTACDEDEVEAAIRLGDFFLADIFSDDPEEQIIGYSVLEGPNGFALYDESDGKTSVSGDIAQYEMTHTFGLPTDLNVGNGVPLYSSNDRSMLRVAPEGYSQEVMYWNAATLMESTADEEIISEFWLTVSEDETVELSELEAQLAGYIEEQMAAFITGTRDLAEWDEFLEELNDFQMDRYIEIMNNAYSN